MFIYTGIARKVVCLKRCSDQTESFIISSVITCLICVDFGFVVKFNTVKTIACKTAYFS